MTEIIKSVIDLHRYDPTLERINERHRIHYEEVLREGFARNLSHAHDAAERALEYSKRLARDGHCIFDELEQAETYMRGLLLAILLQQRVHADLQKANDNE